MSVQVWVTSSLQCSKRKRKKKLPFCFFGEKKKGTIAVGVRAQGWCGFYLFFHGSSLRADACVSLCRSCFAGRKKGKKKKDKKGRKIHWQLNYASAFCNALKNCLSKRVLFKHNSLSVTVVFFPGRKPF